MSSSPESEREGGVVHIPYSLPPRFTGDVEGWIASAQQYMGEQYRLIQRLSGGALRWQNLRSSLIWTGATNQPPDTGAADSMFQLIHDLGKVPEVYFWMLEATTPAATTISHRTTDVPNWSITTIDLRCNIANQTVGVLVM